MMRGSCLCGAVVFEVTPPARDVIACHCTQCRKTSGHFWAASSVPHDRFRLVRDDGLRWYRSSPRAQRGFCGQCGSSLLWQPEGEAQIYFAAGAIEGESGLRMAEHIHVASKGDYYEITDGLPQQAGWE